MSETPCRSRRVAGTIVVRASLFWPMTSVSTHSLLSTATMSIKKASSIATQETNQIGL